MLSRRRAFLFAMRDVAFQFISRLPLLRRSVNI
jgi:hypothetical protein